MLTEPDQYRGPGGSDLAPTRYQAAARRLCRAAAGLVALASLLSLSLVGAAAAHADDMWEFHLALENGWTNAQYGAGPAGIEGFDGVLYLSGAITTTGTNPVAFTLPSPDRPWYDVYVPVDMCNGTHGQLHIAPSGVVTVEAGNWANAQCFTSLDGVSFVQSPDTSDVLPDAWGQWLNLAPGWTTGQNGDTTGPFGTAQAGVEFDYGVVHFWGAISATGANPVAFTLPYTLRPSHNVFVNVTLCSGANGRLDIYPDGDVQVEPEGGARAWLNAKCMVSLDGASFVLDNSYYNSGAKPVSLEPGWTSGPYGTEPPQVVLTDGEVRFLGAIATSGTNQVAFTLPPNWYLPQYTRYVPVDMCNGTNGRLDIAPSGVVTVEAEGGAWNNAQCFTSLDGALYIP